MSSLQSFVVALIAHVFIFSVAQASVPDSQTFKLINNGEFGNSVAEYNATYRSLNIFLYPFQLCFYNTTPSPNAYSLALSMGSGGDGTRRWVWEANRGNLVGENATFSFGKDGNLVLAEADGDIVWQSATANKGVVGFKLLPNGNMVLHDSQGNYIWQSFHSPTDTLLVGQSLQANNSKGSTYLASRASSSQTVNGKYSLMLESQRLALYRDDKNSPTVWIQIGRGALEYVRFNSDPRTHSLRLEYKVANSSTNGAAVIAFPTFNTSLTYLRLGIDGNMKAFTYYATSWSETYSLFRI